MRVRHLACLAALVAALCGSLPAAAADLTPAPEPQPAALANDWHYQLTLYGWATSMNGDVGIRNLPTASVDLSFIDILKNLDGAVMGSFYATNGQWMVLTDLIWAKVSDRIDVGRFGGSVKFEQKQAIVSGVVGYALPLGVPSLQLNATAGVRYNHLTAEVDFDPALVPASISREGTKSWIDPTIGLFMHYDINDRWFINAAADIGGFGVGSKFTTQGFATVGYMWTKNISTALGFRVLYTDYDKDNFLYKMTQYGPFASLGVHF